MATPEQEYVLGTHDEEIERLGLQHRAWLPLVAEAWTSAGIGLGQTVLDLGCGPGYASLDLAELVGPSGRIVAVDKSEKFLSTLEAMRRDRKLENIVAYRTDLEEGKFPDVLADRVWCRWVFAFLKRPREVLARVTARLKPGGVIVLHEYVDYATWRGAPRCPELEEFVQAVMASWRSAGGEPDIALSLLGWLEDLGFEIRSHRAILTLVQPGDMKWDWVRSFLEVGRQRLVDLGFLSAQRAEAIGKAILRFEDSASPRMITPAVLEIIAVRRD